MDTIIKSVETVQGVAKVYFQNGRQMGGGGRQSLTPKQRMDLMSCKTKVKEDSKKEPKRIFYINIDDEGECSVSTKSDPSSTFYAYRNGSEIPLVIESKETSSSQLNKSNNNQSSEDGNLDNNMEVTVGKKKATAKKAVAKKSNSKSSAKKGERKQPKVEGVKKTLSVKAIRAEIKAGKVVRLASGFYFSEAFLATKADQEKKHDVFVKG